MSKPVDYKTLNSRYKKPELIKLYLHSISELQNRDEIIKDLKSKVIELEASLTECKQEMETQSITHTISSCSDEREISDESMPTEKRNTESTNKNNNEESNSSFIDEDETVPTNSRNKDSANKTNNEDSQSTSIDEDDTSDKSMTTDSANKTNNEDSKSTSNDEDDTSDKSMTTDSANKTNNEDSKSTSNDEDDTSDKSMTTESDVSEQKAAEQSDNSTSNDDEEEMEETQKDEKEKDLSQNEDMEPENSIFPTHEGDYDSSDDESKKYPNSSQLQISKNLESHLREKIRDFIKAKKWNSSNMTKAPFTMYRFVNKIMTRVFTIEYLRTHKKSNQGGAKGKVQKKKMSNKHLQYLLQVTCYAWRKLTDENNKLCSKDILHKMATKCISQVINNVSR